MTMAQIQHFLDIVNWGGFSAAASETFISQSSLSKQIKSLESELNVQLFDRTNNKIALTPGGTAFLEYARKLNNTYKAMLQDMEQYSSAKKTISMGILPLEQGYRLLERLTSYQVAMERVQVNITEDNQGKLIPLLDHGKLDFAVVLLKHAHLSAGAEHLYEFFAQQGILAQEP